MTMLVALLLVDGYMTRTVGASSTGAKAGERSRLAGALPVLRARGQGLAPTGPAPGRRIALTFDDGPDPAWTPRIAAILRREHVPATFFVVGSQAIAHPELVTMLAHDGFELGNHTFTHVDLAAVSGAERRLQISLTESAIAGIVGARPRLVRPPYSSTTSAVTREQERAWSSLARRGYLIVLSTFDGEDWSQPGVSSIVRNATPPGAQGGIVLLHDAGGRRAETVAALPLLIRRLRARGFRFVRASQLAGLPPGAAAVPATAGQRMRGEILVSSLTLAGVVTMALTATVAAITLLAALRMLFALVVARIHVRRVRRHPSEPSYHPPVSIIVPAYNEATCIEPALRSLASSCYPGLFEIVVVDDGSTDGTAHLVQALPLGAVRLITQANSGKAAALNRGVAAARHDVIVTVDADTQFEPDTLLRLVQRLNERGVGAVSGNAKVGNRSGLIGRWQHIEYVMGFNLDRRMYEVLGCTPTIPGAIGAFRRQALLDAGGFSAATLAEDTDVALELGRGGWKVVYAEDARAWTEAPNNLRDLFRQRRRWAYGTLQSVWKHRHATGRRERSIGLLAIPYVTVFQILMPLAAPLIDLFAIYGILFLDPLPILGFWLAFNGIQAVLAWSAFGFDGERRRVLWALPLQQFVYRQVMYLVVMDAVVSALLGSRLGWNGVGRTGTAQLPTDRFVAPRRRVPG